MPTIRQRVLKDGSHSYNIQVKFKDKGSGRLILESTTWRPEKNMTPKQEERAVLIFADAFEKKLKDMIRGSAAIYENPNVTFRDFSKVWLDKTKRECSLIYYTKCVDMVNLSNEYIGGHRLRDISPAIIQSFFDKLDQMKKKTSKVFPQKEFRQILESAGYGYMKLRYDMKIQSCTLANAFSGKSISKGWSMDFAERVGISFEKLFLETVTEEPYAYETIHQIKRTVRAILSVAKKNRLIDDNYASAEYINFPKKPPHKITCMNDDEAKRFYEFVMNYSDIRYKSAMLIFLLMGLRRGETSGLEWKDINFEKKEMTISRSITTVKGHGMVLKDPKTEMSKRTLSMPDILTSVLKEYKKWQDNRRDELGDYMQENDYVFIQENGARLYPSTFTGWLNKMLKDAGIEHYSLHSLRHTNITMQIAEGVPIVTVSARAGHARTSTTTDIYAYFLKSSDKSAAQTISNAFERENDSSDDTLQQFKQVKAEMSRLGFSTISEYQEYLEFLNFKKNNNL